MQRGRRLVVDVSTPQGPPRQGDLRVEYSGERKPLAASGTGRFEMDNPPEDGFDLRVTVRGYAEALETVAAEAVAACPVLYRSIQVSNADALLTGQVLRPDGAPAEGARVRLQARGACLPFEICEARCDERGYFALPRGRVEDWMKEDQLGISATDFAAGSSWIELEEARAAKPFVIRLEEWPTIRVKAVDAVTGGTLIPRRVTLTTNVVCIGVLRYGDWRRQADGTIEIELGAQERPELCIEADGYAPYREALPRGGGPTTGDFSPCEAAEWKRASPHICRIQPLTSTPAAGGAGEAR